MTRTDISAELRRVTEGQAFITVTQLARALGEKNTSRVKTKYLEGLESVNGKYYLITEVADALKRSCAMG